MKREPCAKLTSKFIEDFNFFRKENEKLCGNTDFTQQMDKSFVKEDRKEEEKEEKEEEEKKKKKKKMIKFNLYCPYSLKYGQTYHGLKEN
ncbi:hypothetical protein STEG23_010966 [Scotinomys teguina]